MTEWLDRFLDLGEFLLIRGLFLFFLSHFLELLSVDGVCEAKLRLCIDSLISLRRSFFIKVSTPGTQMEPDINSCNDLTVQKVTVY